MLRLLVKSLFFVVPVPIGVAEAKTMLIFALMLLFLVAVEVECIREVVVVAMKAVVLTLKRKREEFKNDREARMSFTVYDDDNTDTRLQPLVCLCLIFVLFFKSISFGGTSSTAERASQRLRQST